MTRRQNILISTPLEPARREQVLASALARWPFLNPTHKFVSSKDRIVINLPDLTDSDAENHYACLDQNYQVHDEMPEWSKAFPGITFALIETDSFGGITAYSGSIFQTGERLLVSNSLTELLREIGVECHGAFPKLL